MNRIMIGGSMVGIVFFIGLLLLTIFAQKWIADFARDYINRRIEPPITRTVDALERDWLSSVADNPELVADLTAEITRYRNNPQDYIRSITSGELPDAAQGGWLAQATDSLKKTYNAKRTLPQIIGDHFRKVFEHLIRDVRIFSVTNIIAFAVVLFLMRGFDGRSLRLVVQAFIPFLATCYVISVYIKQDWFFNLLLDHHMGLLYPFLLIMTAIDLWLRWRGGKLRQRAAELTKEMIAG